jgi:endonuclease/exonuclease/phosphatase family metal-dependent hydrolase
MRFSILTYNLLFHQAIPETLFLLKKNQPDIVCLQEISTNEIPQQIFADQGYQLAATSNSFIKRGKIYGLATFYNQKKLKIVRYENNKIPHTMYDWWRYITNLIKRKAVRKSVLKTVFQIINSREKITVFNIHLTAEATNEARIKQLKEILKQTQKSKPPIILVGDFNYVPYKRKKLERILKKYGFKEGTSKIDYTFSTFKNTNFYGWLTKAVIKLIGLFYPNYKLDFIFYKKLKLKEAKRIQTKISDHYPIIAVFEN